MMLNPPSHCYAVRPRLSRYENFDYTLVGSRLLSLSEKYLVFSNLGVGP